MFLIGIPVYKLKGSFLKLLESLQKLNQNLISKVVFYIQPSEDIDQIINYIESSNINSIYYVNEKNIGMVSNWNNIIDFSLNYNKSFSSNAQYLIINHDDDFPNRFILDIYLKILTISKFSNIPIIASKQIFSTESKHRKFTKKILSTHIIKTRYQHYKPKDFYKYLVNDFTLSCSSVALNIDFIRNYNLSFSSKYPYSSDEEFWFKALDHGSLLVLKKYLVHRTIDAKNTGSMNYEFETWKKPDFLDQFILCRKDIIRNYCQDNKFVNMLLQNTLKICFEKPFFGSSHLSEINEFKNFIKPK